MKTLGIIFCLLSLTSLSSVRGQAALSIQELWEYGRGPILDFNWSAQDLLLFTRSHIWQVNPVSGQPPVEAPVDYFPISTSLDGTRYVTQGQGDTLIRDTTTDAVIFRIPRSYYNIAWQPRSGLLTTGGYDEDAPAERRYYLELWNTDSGELAATVGGYDRGVKAFDWHPDGALLAASLIKGTIIIEDVTRSESVHELSTSSTADTVVWSPDGTKLAATAPAHSPIDLWRTDTFEAITAANHPSFVVTVAWNADSARLAGALLGGGVGIWNTDTGELSTLGVEADDGTDRIVERLEWNGELLAAWDRTQRLRVWDVDDNTLIWDSTENQFHSILTHIAVSSNGERVALGYYNSREIPVLNGLTGTHQQSLRPPEAIDRIFDMAWSPSGERLAVSDGDLFIWSLESTDPIQVENVGAISWSPDGRLAVLPWGSGELRLIDGQTGELLDTPEIDVLSLRWSPDGRYLALRRKSPDAESAVRYQMDVWEIQPNTLTTIDFSHTDSIPGSHFGWLPDSSGLIGYTDNGALWRWDVGTEQAQIVAPAPSADPTNQPFWLSVNGRGDLLAVINPATDWHVHILDVETGARLAVIELAPGRRIFTWGGDDLLFVYDGILHAYRVTVTS